MYGHQVSHRTKRLAVVTLLLLITCLIWLASRRDDGYRWEASSQRPAAPFLSTQRLSTDDKNAKRGPRIAIVTFITSQKSYIHLSLRNKAHYARAHNYTLIVDYESHASRGTTWKKFDMIEDVVRAGTHDWVWWLDFDTLITNTTMAVADVIEEALGDATATGMDPGEVDFLVTDDCNNLNDGSFIARSSPRTVATLDAIRALHDREKSKGNDLNDQDAMRDFLRTDDPLVKHTLRIPQWKINAFPEEIKCYDGSGVGWARGMLLVHFAGAWAHVEGEDPTGELMRKYEREIIWGEVPEG
ncbi:uncharacterized protein EI97DRAFT_435366 [Westerdykella ornata]|uniref:Glycosyltransferase family 34 protein n=1 Tax=Westerdykella ornata TaxID=318751 RepID=A0A6A6JE45_WESOR|nr:uncharacterized protein EI97DRAFT_435366 [Westerdykella ornata]KAF2274278.1 hypothetical protein EI97DRAFT_435366 [Westerdykella ornata]